MDLSKDLAKRNILLYSFVDNIEKTKQKQYKYPKIGTWLNIQTILYPQDCCRRVLIIQKKYSQHIVSLKVLNQQCKMSPNLYTSTLPIKIPKSVCAHICMYICKYNGKKKRLIHKILTVVIRSGRIIDVLFFQYYQHTFFYNNRGFLLFLI